MTDTYPLDIEPWEQNISTQVDFASKWKDMLPSNIPIPTPISASENTRQVCMKEEATLQRVFSARQITAACAPTNIRNSVLCANVLSAES